MNVACTGLNERADNAAFAQQANGYDQTHSISGPFLGICNYE